MAAATRTVTRTVTAGGTGSDIMTESPGRARARLTGRPGRSGASESEAAESRVGESESVAALAQGWPGSVTVTVAVTNTVAAPWPGAAPSPGKLENRRGGSDSNPISLAASSSY